MSAQREAFEAWAKGVGLSVSAVTTGEYFSGATQTAWHVWQAAQAAMPVNPDAGRDLGLLIYRPDGSAS